MSRESTIRDLRVKVRQFEAKKREIDKQVENLHGAIRVFEQNGDAENEDRSSYAREVSDAMLDILTDERPLHRNVVLARVQQRGIHVGGTKPVNSIGSYLSTDQRFKNCGRGMWTLAEEPQAGNSITGSITDIPSLNIPDFVSVPHIRDYEDVDDLPF